MFVKFWVFFDIEYFRLVLIFILLFVVEIVKRLILILLFFSILVLYVCFLNCGGLLFLLIIMIGKVKLVFLGGFFVFL